MLGARSATGKTRWPRGASSRRAPPRRSEAGGQQEWVERNAAQARRALLDPAVRAELLALLGTDDSEQRQARRQEEARRDLASMELRWKLAEDEVWEPLETIFGTIVVVLAGLAVIGALVVVLVAEWFVIRRVVERHRNQPMTDADFWRQQRALTEPT